MAYSKPRHVWRAIYPVLLFLNVQLIAGVIFMFIFSFLMIFVFPYNAELNAAISRLNTDALFSGNTELFLRGLAESGYMNLYFDAVMWLQLGLSATAFAVLFPIMRYSRSKSVSYFGGKLNLKTILLLIGAGIGANYIVSTVIGLLNLIEYFPDYAEIESLITGGSLLPQILAVGIVGPITEEICFRGWRMTSR